MGSIRTNGAGSLRGFRPSLCGGLLRGFKWIGFSLAGYPFGALLLDVESIWGFMPRLSLITIICVLSCAVYANYDATKWGMALTEVQKAYPGGLAQDLQNGDTVYRVVRPIAGLPTGLLRFYFRPTMGLREVTIMFPRQGSEINLTTDTYFQATKQDAEAIRQVLRVGLNKRYGLPAISGPDGGESWLTPDQDMVSLSMFAKDATFATVELDYRKLGTADSEVPKGL